jgi:hypothetical protein
MKAQTPRRPPGFIEPCLPTIADAVRAVLAKPGSWAKFGLQGCLAAAAKRLHHNISPLARSVN